jgi:hypothetical protein
MKLTTRFVFQISAAIVLALAIFPSVSAQSPSERDREREANERDLELRSWNLRLISLNARKHRYRQPNVQQSLAQLQEDFTRLQVLNKNLGRAAIANGALDFKFVSKSVSEIKKRAERLNSNLALPEPEMSNANPNSDAAVHPGQLKASVLKLVRLVYRFVDNPFFKEASVVDTQLTSEARRDLEQIIELSEQIKKSGGKPDNAGDEKPRPQ